MFAPGLFFYSGKWIFNQGLCLDFSKIRTNQLTKWAFIDKLIINRIPIKILGLRDKGEIKNDSYS